MKNSISNFESPINGVGSEFVTRAGHQKLMDIVNLSPCDANTHVHITQNDSGYTGVLSVISAQGKFISQAFHENFNKMFDEMISIVDDKLRIWKSNRNLLPN